MSHILNKSYLPIHLPLPFIRRALDCISTSLTCIPRCTSVLLLHQHLLFSLFLLLPLLLLLLLALIQPRRPPSTLAMIISPLSSPYSSVLHSTPSIFELVEKQQGQRRWLTLTCSRTFVLIGVAAKSMIFDESSLPKMNAGKERRSERKREIYSNGRKRDV